MAEYRDHNGIRCFEPDDDATKFHIRGDYSNISLQDVIDRARETFGPDVDLDDIQISAEHIQTQCLGYDQYDAGDWTDYIVVEHEPQT